MAMFSLLLVAILVATSAAAPFPVAREYPRLECPAGWALIDRTCFLLGDASGTWEEGQDYCNTQGATLATISSQTQQDAIAERLTESVWIGLTDLKEDNSYGWADGSDYSYTSWDEGEPNNSGDIMWLWGEREDCVEMRKKVGYMWNDEHCDETRQFLCSMPPEEITTTTTTTTTTTPAPVCEEGWDMLGRSTCYKVSDVVATWYNARDACLAADAQLAAITSEEQQTFLAALLSTNTWIGLSDEAVEGTFTWLDGTEAEYTNWEDGEPNNSYSLLTLGVGEDCVEMRPDEDFKWNDELCTMKRLYVCEKPTQ